MTKMKKIILLTVLATIIYSCTIDKEEIELNTTNNLEYTVPDITSNTGLYKGIFTTNDSKIRATIAIVIPNNQPLSYSAIKPYATLRFMNGKIVQLSATTTINYNNSINNLLFKGSNISFKFSVAANGNNPIITDVKYQDTESFILIRKEKQQAPISTITGTYVCDECGTHPNLNNGQAQTYSFIITPDPNGGDDIISSQIMAGTTMYTGTGTQNNCIDNGTLTSCEINGVTNLFNSTSSFTGLHIFNNENTNAGNDCSQVSGTWSWDSVNFGALSGTFISDNNCNFNTIAIEDYDGGIPAWPAATDVPFFDNGSDGFFGPNNGATSGANQIDFPKITGNFLFLRDLNDEGENGTTGDATITFSNINVSGNTNIQVAFDYDVNEYDNGDDVSYRIVLDGIDQPEVILVDGFSDLTAKGTEVINIPNGTTTVGFKLILNQNGPDNAGFDNFRIMAQ